MMNFVITIHVIACILLIVLVLIQRGRGGGLVDSFSGVESMFGTKTNAFLTRVTTVFAIVFFFTCLGLALLSVKKSKSLIGDTKPAASQSSTEAPKQETLPVAPAEPNQPLQGAAK
jgi:preprotein translocase subunit SecG